MGYAGAGGPAGGLIALRAAPGRATLPKVERVSPSEAPTPTA